MRYITVNEYTMNVFRLSYIASYCETHCSVSRTVVAASEVLGTL